MFKRFTNRLSGRTAKALGFFSDDIAIYVRPSKRAHTFALALDYGGREFPHWIIADVPLREVKVWLRTACRGARVLRRLGVYRDLEKAYEIGQELEVSQDEILAIRWGCVWSMILARLPEEEQWAAGSYLLQLEKEGLNPHQAFIMCKNWIRS